jgi:hypothetical protein
MPRIRQLYAVFLFLGLAGSLPARADAPSADFRPDPRSVERYGPAYRYPQAGWIVLHIEGQPYERGYQHGKLMSPEIAAFVRTWARTMSPTAPAEGWRNTRTLVNALFVRRYEREYLEEMKGIADGASAAGAKYEGRPIDLVDIVGLNVWPEIETLESALEATPTGLEGIRFPDPQPRQTPPPKPMHCSAFAATGPATADGKIVFGHITMVGLYEAPHNNVWIDVKPAQGHRVIMQSYPGGIQSGLDYYLNDAGLLVTETTIAQTKFDINGLSVASRIRKAMQYADSIDGAVDILKSGNNGLYTNEWLLGDIKTNEIAMFELGTDKSRLYRSSKNDWYGNTPGFYWGCNNTKDRQVRLETIPGVNDRPANMVFAPTDRDVCWFCLFDRFKGKIDADFGKLAFTTPPLAAYHSIDAKFTTTELAKELKSWALFGPPLGKTWLPTEEEKRRYPDIRPLVGNPWTILNANRPEADSAGGPPVVDIPTKTEEFVQTSSERDRRNEAEKAMPIAWHGTIFPKTDADIWLATAFADYERFVADLKTHERQAEKDKHRELASSDREELAVRLYGDRAQYLAGSRTVVEKPLDQTHRAWAQSDWYDVAAGKGCLVLQELRQLMGTEAFVKMMDDFGRQNAGKEVTSAQFEDHVEKTVGKPMKEFFAYWLQQPGLPALRLGSVNVANSNGGFKVEGEIVRDAKLPRSTVRVTVEGANCEPSQLLTLDGSRTSFSIECKSRPQRLVVDKYNETAKLNGGVFSVLSFQKDLAHSLIVYGTADEISTNREAAEALQRAIVERWSNFTLPIKSDKEVTEEELRGHHLLLIGRPDSNTIVRRFQNSFPISFGSRSFVVGNEAYAHAGSAVAAAAENPLNPHYSIVVATGLCAESTRLAAAQALGRGQVAAEVVVMLNHAVIRNLALPARDLVKDLSSASALTAK